MNRRHDLQVRLLACQPTDPLEANHLRRLHALLEAPADPFHRGQFEPGHVTASAFVLSPDGGSLLLILHGKLHRWLQPGGHVDALDGDVEAAARREVAEEVDLHDLTAVLAPGVPFDIDVHDIPALKNEPAHAHFDVRFLFRASSLAMRAGSDARAAQWVRLEAVQALESDASVLRAVAKLQGRD